MSPLCVCTCVCESRSCFCSKTQINMYFMESKEIPLWCNCGDWFSCKIWMNPQMICISTAYSSSILSISLSWGCSLLPILIEFSSAGLQVMFFIAGGQKWEVTEKCNSINDAGIWSHWITAKYGWPRRHQGACPPQSPSLGTCDSHSLLAGLSPTSCNIWSERSWVWGLAWMFVCTNQRFGAHQDLPLAEWASPGRIFTAQALTHSMNGSMFLFYFLLPWAATRHLYNNQHFSEQTPILNVSAEIETVVFISFFKKNT